MAINAQDRTAKTKELILYISSCLKDKGNYGSVLLNKSLYLIDSMSYLKLRKPISHFEYIRQRFGPTPKPSQFLSIRDDMVISKDIEVIMTDYFGKEQKKIKALREPNTSLFSVEEKRIIDAVLSTVCDTTAIDISNYSHEFISWQFAGEKEPLPYYTFLLTSREPEPADYEWAKRSIEKYQKSKGLS